jgi:hypothetical protein
MIIRKKKNVSRKSSPKGGEGVVSRYGADHMPEISRKGLMESHKND